MRASYSNISINSKHSAIGGEKQFCTAAFQKYNLQVFIIIIIIFRFIKLREMGEPTLTYLLSVCFPSCNQSITGYINVN